MNKRTIFSVTTSTLVATLAVVGVTAAATPAANDTSLLNKGTVEVDSLKVGKQDVGGVTFFNGTIINSTTTNGNGNPVTFGDDVRIDGRVFRGSSAGTSDSQPFIVNDNFETTGSISMGAQSLVQVITPAEFNTGNLDTNAEETFTSTIAGSSGNGDYIYAPVHLPDGAVLTGLDWFMIDNSASDGELKLWKNSIQDGDTYTDVSRYATIATVSTSSQDTVVRKVSMSNLSETIANDSSYYTLEANLPDSNVGVVKALLHYTVTRPY